MDGKRERERARVQGRVWDSTVQQRRGGAGPKRGEDHTHTTALERGFEETGFCQGRRQTAYIIRRRPSHPIPSHPPSSVKADSREREKRGRLYNSSNTEPPLHLVVLGEGLGCILRRDPNLGSAKKKKLCRLIHILGLLLFTLRSPPCPSLSKMDEGGGLFPSA